MQHFPSIKEAYPVCLALGSAARQEIMELVLAGEGINLSQLAQTLHLTNGALTKHIKVLAEAGLIRIESAGGAHGRQKICRVNTDKILIDVSSDFTPSDSAGFEVNIGSFCDCTVAPFCGIVTREGFIGERDEPRYFSYPKRIDAAALWLRQGKLSYILPSPPKKKLSSLSISLELSAKCAGIGGSGESKVSFYIDGTALGAYALGGEYFDRRGNLTPAWYDSALPQYGKYIMLSIGEKGTFVDGIKISPVTIAELKSPNTFTLQTSTGLMLFGAGFGDYDSHIRLRFNG